DGDLLAQVASRDGGGDLRDVADLPGEVGSHVVDVVGEVAPGAGDALHLRLTTEPSFGADSARDTRDLVGEGRQLVDHRVDRLRERGDLALRIDRDLLREVALGHSGGDLGDVADLTGQVCGHAVHVLGEVTPGAGHALHLRLTTQSAF